VAEPVVLVGERRRSMTVPVFLSVVLLAALLRGWFGAGTTGGRVALVATIGTLLLLVGAFTAHLARRPPDRLEIRPDRIVLWQGPDRGVQLGTTPPIVVERRFLRAGTSVTTTWVLRDAAGVAHRFAGGTSTPLDGPLATIDLTEFHPARVFEALQQAGWNAEQRA
jgi:hypothetical protein